MPDTESPAEFKRGWDAAVLAVRRWHEAQASKALVQARRSRFPKNLEREAEVHRKSAELILTLARLRGFACLQRYFRADGGR
jgi:hypothetical protein